MNGPTKDPRTLGSTLPHLLADALAHNRQFLDALAQARPATVEGTVTAVQRDSSGSNRVTIRRTGQPRSDATNYVVWSPMHVPIVGDIVRLLIVGKGAAVILGAKHGGRPNEHTIAYAGGAHHHYDSARNHIHKHGDDHHHRHYHTDGTTITHHHHGTSGYHAHIGGHLMGGGGGMSIADDGTPGGTYHEKIHNLSRYEHYQSGTLVRHHDVTGDHGHYANGALLHHIVTTGAAGGQVRLKQHNAAYYHVHGDDGTGHLHLFHASKGTAWLTDGTQHTWYTNTNANGTQPTLSHIAVGTQGGQLRAQQHNTFGTYHLLGDDAAGNLHAQSAAAAHYIRLSGGASAHLHNANGHTHPSGAYENAPSTDGSVINVFSNAGTGALKRASHSTSPQVVGTGSASITTNNNFAHYQWPSAANGDPHLKVISACVWDPAHTSNPGLYSHTPANAAGTTTSYGASVLTSATTSDANHIWGVGALTPDSQVYLWGSSIGGAGSLAVGMAFWAHVIL